MEKLYRSAAIHAHQAGVFPFWCRRSSEGSAGHVAIDQPDLARPTQGVEQGGIGKLL